MKSCGMPMAFAVYGMLKSIIPLFLTFAIVCSGPVQVQIEQGHNSNFHIGPQPRSTFELVEEYHPLAIAYNPQHRPRALASSLTKGPAQRINSQVLTNFGDQNNNASLQQAQELGQIHKQLDLQRLSNNGGIIAKPKRSYWTDWSRWSSCTTGERIRVRQCIEVDNVKCEGVNEQRQRCFGFQSQTLVAKDPLVIEKEILGVDPSQPIRRV